MTQSSRKLGDLIREQRKLARLSLRDLAGMSRISNAYLSQVERGIHEPSLRVLRAVAEALDVPLETMVPTSEGTMSDAEGPGLEEAIRVDTLLSAEEKQALLTIYRSMVGHKNGGAAADGPEQAEEKV